MYIWCAMWAYIATIIFYSFEHVVNFITWTRTSRKSAESGSRSVVAEVVAEITEQGSTDHQVRDKKISWSASGHVDQLFGPWIPITEDQASHSKTNR